MAKHPSAGRSRFRFLWHLLVFSAPSRGDAASGNADSRLSTSTRTLIPVALGAATVPLEVQKFRDPPYLDGPALAMARPRQVGPTLAANMSSLSAAGAAGAAAAEEPPPDAARKLECERELREEACLWGKKEMVVRLLADPVGVDVNAVSRSGNTALMMAASSMSSIDNGLGDDSLISVLLLAGSDIHLKSREVSKCARGDGEVEVTRASGLGPTFEASLASATPTRLPTPSLRPLLDPRARTLWTSPAYTSTPAPRRS